MAGLTNIFGGNDESSTSNSAADSSDVMGDLNTTLGLDANSSQSSYDQDEDGNISAQQSDNSLGLDTSTDGLLSSVTDSFSSNDQTTE
ncbi:MAG: hypothetical protein PGN21_03920 [Sphingomonas paucimobilis]